jgi:hypothetical protein
MNDDLRFNFEPLNVRTVQCVVGWVSADATDWVDEQRCLVSITIDKMGKHTAWSVETDSTAKGVLPELTLGEKQAAYEVARELLDAV